MKFVIEQEKFAAALGAPVRVANSRASSTAVGGVLIQTHGARALVLTGTDGYTSIKVAVEADIVEPGVVLLPARRLSDCVRALDGNIIVSTEKDRAHIESGTFETDLVVMPAGNFPELGDEKGVEVEVDPKEFVEAVAQVAPAASRDESRAHLMGIRLEVHGDVLTLAATDGVRIALRRLAVQTNTDFAGVIPFGAMFEAQRAAVGAIRIVLLDEKVRFEAPRFKMVTPLVRGKYPDYEKIIPKDIKGTIVVNRASLMTALRRVALVGDDKPVRLKTEDLLLHLSVVSPGIGEASEVISTDPRFRPEDLDMWFNTRYLLDGAESVRGTNVSVGFTEPLRPALVRGMEAQNFTYMLMPVRVNKTEEAKV